MPSAPFAHKDRTDAVALLGMRFLLVQVAIIEFCSSSFNAHHASAGVSL